MATREKTVLLLLKDWIEAKDEERRIAAMYAPREGTGAEFGTPPVREREWGTDGLWEVIRAARKSAQCEKALVEAARKEIALRG